ncbi:hypothetical protein TNCV_4145641 [Trichonephila clavipes]|nr:hypothetical protein TNCV_4145641 [Trichonephila clavipes]
MKGCVGNLSAVIVIPLNFSQRKSSIREVESCNVVASNGDRRLWWTRHSHVHLEAADIRLRRGRSRNPFFDPRGIEPRRPEDERDDALNLLGSGGQTIPPLANYWTLTIFN